MGRMKKPKFTPAIEMASEPISANAITITQP